MADLLTTVKDSTNFFLEAVRVLGVKPCNIKMLCSKEDYKTIVSSIFTIGTQKSLEDSTETPPFHIFSQKYLKS